MTFAELRLKAAQSYIRALESNDDAKIGRLYDEGDRYNDIADALVEQLTQESLNWPDLQHPYRDVSAQIGAHSGLQRVDCQQA